MSVPHRSATANPASPERERAARAALAPLQQSAKARANALALELYCPREDAQLIIVYRSAVGPIMVVRTTRVDVRGHISGTGMREVRQVRRDPVVLFDLLDDATAAAMHAGCVHVGCPECGFDAGIFLPDLRDLVPHSGRVRRVAPEFWRAVST